jgi:hypothetical protein
MGPLGLLDALDYLTPLAAEKPDWFDRAAREFDGDGRDAS